MLDRFEPAMPLFGCFLRTSMAASVSCMGTVANPT